MRTGGPLFLVGAVALTHFAGLPPVSLLCLLPAAVLAAARGRRGWRWLGWLACGFLWALLRADYAEMHRFDTSLEGRVLQVQGVVASLPRRRPGRARFEFLIQHRPGGRAGRQHLSGKVVLSWYLPPAALVPGDCWRLRVKLKRPWGFRDPGVRDYQAWLFQRRILATGYVISGRRMAGTSTPFRWRLDRVRYGLRKRLRAKLAHDPLGSLVIALALGDRGSMTSGQWRVLTATGTSHLVSVSGLHVGLIAGLVFLIARLLWPLCGSACLRIAAPRFAAVPALAAAAAYAALAGFSVPTQRALIMLCAWMTATIVCRRRSVLDVVSTALFLVLIVDPFCTLAPGFWLSFGAVAVIAFGLSGHLRRAGNWWRVQLVVTTGLLPLLALWFHQWPLLAIPANLLAVPWISLLTLPLVLAGCLTLLLYAPAGAALLHMAAGSLHPLWFVLGAMAGWHPALFPVATPASAALAAGVVGALLVLMPRGLPGRWIGLFWLMPLLWPPGVRPAQGELGFTLLDVGEGLSAVVRTANHVLLYETGPRYSRWFNAGRAVVVPYLHNLGVRKLDVIVQSHGNGTRTGALVDVLRHFPVARILTAVPERMPVSGVVRCRSGQAWSWDGVRFRILHPPSGADFHGHDDACVLRVSTAHRSLLLTGDIGRRAESAMLAEQVHLKSSVLVAPHHGSRTASTPGFVAAVHPDYVLFSTGFHNRFGFPKQAIIARYRRYGSKILDTAHSGAIEIRIRGGGISVRTQRQTAARFWQSRPDPE